MPYTHGTNIFTYGVPVLTGHVAQSYNLGVKSLLNQIVVNESGQQIFRRQDDLISEISIEAIVGTGTPPIPGTVIYYQPYTLASGIPYEVTSYDLKGTNKNSLEISIKAHTTQYVPLP